MFFDSLAGLARVLIVGTLAYLSLVLLLRISGKRTLTKLNAFDLVVTVALGSTLATILLNRSVALVEGIVAFGLLIGLQWVIAWLSVRSAAFQGLIKSEPKLLVHQGQLLEGAMKRERISREEVFAVLRADGAHSIDDVAAVVLETDGSMTVIRESDGSLETLATVAMPARPFGRERSS